MSIVAIQSMSFTTGIFSTFIIKLGVSCLTFQTGMCPDFTSPSITNSPVYRSKLMTCYVPEEASNPAPVAPAACHDEAGWNRGVFRRKVGNTGVGPRLGQVGHRLPFPVVANFGRCDTT